MFVYFPIPRAIRLDAQVMPLICVIYELAVTDSADLPVLLNSKEQQPCQLRLPTLFFFLF
jgi:hypothetical protein